MSRVLLHFGRPTLAMLALLVLAQWSVVLAFWNVRGLDAPLIFTVALVGLVIGWVLGSSSLPILIAFPMAAALGIEFLVVQIGQLGVRIALLFVGLLRFIGGSVPWFIAGPFDLASGRVIIRAGPGRLALDAFREGTGLWEAILAMANRMWQWAAGIAGGKPYFDPVAAALAWGLAVFLLAAWAAWNIRARSRAFEAILPTLLASAALLVYTGGTGWSIVPALAALLLSMPLVSHATRERNWARTGVGYSEELRFDLTIVMLPLTIALIGVASLVPSFSPGDIARSVQDVLRDRPARSDLPESFGIAPAPRPTTIFDTFGATGLPRQQLIGMRPDQSNQVVMTIRVEPGAEGIEQPGTRYYWRSLTYDRYSGTGWYVGSATLLDRTAGQPATDAKGFATRQLRQRVHLVQPDGLAYSAGQLITVDVPFRVARRSPNDLFSASVMKDDYIAESFLVIPTAEQLRSSGTDYPDWVEQGYLALPSAIPGRVLSLARDLTAVSRTPYDRAEAIETYLRDFPYTLDVPMPPPSRDVTDYFLFDLKRGYCDYYATAMVVLARASGLPARLVVGYGTGA
ncbi:MAG: transglutaminase domain-containing protein, partial [Rudaea sp.]